MSFSPHFSKILCLLLLLALPALAKVDQAEQASKTASEDHVKQGFTRRSEHWSGSAKAAANKGVKAQLVKGNEYWFWLGASVDASEISIEIYDDKGNKVSVETIAGTNAKSIRVIPPSSGSYIIVFSFTNTKAPTTSVDWALTYGYR